MSHETSAAVSSDFVVEGVHCAACIATIEKHLKTVPAVAHARLNLSLKRLHVVWSQDAQPLVVTEALSSLGFRAHAFDPSSLEHAADEEARYLLRCLAVAAFASMNVMLLSVSVWAGHSGNMTPEMRDFFHWVSGLIAIPATAYAGRPFFANAWRALKNFHTNMDVPISIGLVLSLALSVYETFHSSQHAYFDASVMLCTFLLAGRYLDQLMRRRTRAVVANLAALKTDHAELLLPDGTTQTRPLKDIQVGDVLVIAPGDRVPVDGVVVRGVSEVDASLVTGETRPEAAHEGAALYAGSLNLSGSLHLRVERAAEHSFLAEVDKLLEKAMASRPATVLLADKVAKWYAPFVHVTALVSAIGWLVAGAGLHKALVVAITVLIITCPCALALAVPAVHVVAAGALFKRNILLQAGDALERLAEVDTIVFDKTGTLTAPEARLVAQRGDMSLLSYAAQLARASRHPMAKAVAAGLPDAAVAEGIEDVPGQGVLWHTDGLILRMGSPQFCGVEDLAGSLLQDYPAASVIGLSDGTHHLAFAVAQELRSDAKAVIAALKPDYNLHMLSGDHQRAVSAVQSALGLHEGRADAKPSVKVEVMKSLQQQGHKTLMVGDGLNDAPALASAYVSLSPVTAADVTQASSDAVFLGERLAPVVHALRISRVSRRLMNENLAFSVLYNVVFIPLAMLGQATPLIAALAMSGSSVVVTLNALRASRVKEAV